MIKVRLIDNACYAEEDSITIKLPTEEYLTFDIEKGDVIGGIFSDVDYSNENFIEFLTNSSKFDKELDLAIKNCLKVLTFTLYITSNSIEEIIRKLNIANLEEVIEAMIFDEFIEKMYSLYEEYKED